MIEWSETDYHEVYTGYSSGKRICSHTFEYKSVLTASDSITPDVLKSGYGFEGVEFCQKLIGNATINGDMYSDDFSGSD